MTTINGLPYYEIDFNADGTLNTTTGNGDGGLAAAVAAGGITDLFVLSHGWNNGVDSARDLYQAMFSLLADQLGTTNTPVRPSASSGRRCSYPTTTPPPPRPCPPPARSSPPRSHRRSPHQAHDLATIGGLLDDQPQDEQKLTEFHSLATNLVTTPPMAEEDSGESSHDHRRTHRCSTRRDAGARPGRRRAGTRPTPSPGCGRARAKCCAR